MAVKVERNKTFTILSVIAILLILLGHLNWGILEFWGYFPYYSYHVLVFVFVAGYFYKTEEEDILLQYIWRKFKRLIVPYMIVNLICGIVINILHKSGFTFGGELNVRNLLWAPFEGGHQFMLNAPGWFIPALFMLEICNIIGRRMLRLVKLDNEYVIMLLYIVLGIAVVYLAIRGSIYDWRKIPGRLIFMAPVFQFGHLYRDKLEKYDDRINSIVYILVVIAINVILCRTQAGLAFSAVWVTGFANNPVVPYVTIVTGIALWLRIAKLLAKYWDKTGIKLGFIDYAGRHTYEICLFHLSAFLLVNSIIYLAGAEGFDVQAYFSDVYYAFSNGHEWIKAIYILAGMGLPLAGCKVKDIICDKFIKKNG